MKGKLLNSTKYDGKTYALGDVNGFIDVKSVGFDDSFYGGRVKNFGKVTDLDILLCVEKENVIDIFIPDNELEEQQKDFKLTEMPRKDLISYAKQIGVEGKIATMSTEALIQEIEKLAGDKQ